MEEIQEIIKGLERACDLFDKIQEKKEEIMAKKSLQVTEKWVDKTAKKLLQKYGIGFRSKRSFVAFQDFAQLIIKRILEQI